jgi:hypothetical protein
MAAIRINAIKHPKTIPRVLSTLLHLVCPGGISGGVEKSSPIENLLH